MLKRSSKAKSVSYKDDHGRSRSRGCALFIPVVSTIDVIIFILTMYINNCPDHSNQCILRFLHRFSFQPLVENPLLGPSSSTLLKMGGLSSYAVSHEHQFWRDFTCLWLHAGLVHLFVNIVSLLFIGIRLEQQFGCERVCGIYFLSGIGGSLFAQLFLRRQVSAGASTPLLGLLGAVLSDLIINGSMYPYKCPILVVITLISAVNVAIGIFPHNDNFSHLGGFIFGFLLGFVLLIKPQPGEIIPPSSKPHRVNKHKAYQIFLFVTALLLLVIGYSLCIFLSVKGVDGSANCSWCHYLTCVPTSYWKCDADSGGSNRATCNYVVSGNYMFMRCEKNQRTQLYNGYFSVSTLKYLCSKLCG